MSFPVIATLLTQTTQTVQPTPQSRNILSRSEPEPIQIRLEQLNLPLTEYNTYPSIEIEPGYILECYNQQNNQNQLVYTFPSGVCNLSEYVFTHLVIRVDTAVSNPVITEIYTQTKFQGQKINIYLSDLNSEMTNTGLNIISEKISVIVRDDFKVFFQLSLNDPLEILETGAYMNILTPNGFVLFKPVPDTPVSLFAAPVGQVRARLILTPDEILQFQTETEESITESLAEEEKI
jgi:hypothetical protein